MSEQQTIYDKFEGLNRVGRQNEAFTGVTDFLLLGTLVLLIAWFAFRLLTRSNARRVPFAKAKLVESPGRRLGPGADALLSWRDDDDRKSCAGVLVGDDDGELRFIPSTTSAHQPPEDITARLVGREAGELVYIDVTARSSDRGISISPNSERPVRTIRAAARVDCDFKAAAVPPGATDTSDAFFVRVVDIGVNGMGLLSETELATNRRFIVRFTLPRMNEAVSVTVRAAWSKRVKGGLCRAGCEIVSATVPARLQIADFVFEACTRAA